MVQVRVKNKFPETITSKISKTNSYFHLDQLATRKADFIFFKSFLLVLTKLVFWQGDWALSYHPMEFRQSSDIV